MRLGKLGRKIVEDRKKQILLNNLLKTGIKLWTREEDEILLKYYFNGVPVRFINPKNTSRTCSKCGYVRSRVTGRWFKCPICGFQLDRDLNAARNIAKRASLPL